MLSFTGGLKVFVALEGCDMRKGFEGVASLEENQLKEGYTQTNSPLDSVFRDNHILL